jgi:hypothetical protein
MADECRQIIDTYAQRLGLPQDALPVLAATTHIKMVAENRHYEVLHNGPWSRGRTVEDLQVLDRILETFRTASSSATTPSEGLGNSSTCDKALERFRTDGHAPSQAYSR